MMNPIKYTSADTVRVRTTRSRLGRHAQGNESVKLMKSENLQEPRQQALDET